MAESFDSPPSDMVVGIINTKSSKILAPEKDLFLSEHQGLTSNDDDSPPM
jgi:hypothetical protein